MSQSAGTMTQLPQRKAITQPAQFETRDQNSQIFEKNGDNFLQETFWVQLFLCEESGFSPIETTVKGKMRVAKERNKEAIKEDSMEARGSTI